MKRIIATTLALLAVAILSPAVQAWTIGPSKTSAPGGGPGVPLTNPEPRCCMGMDYDSVHDGFIQFGGTGDDDVVLGDTWIGKWSGGPPATFDWTEQLSLVNPPEARHSHRMVFFPPGAVMILFGGVEADSGDVLGDTWIGTVGSGGSFQWEEVSPSPAPSARYSFGLAYDASLEMVILYGGQGGGVQDDTWTGSWNASTEVFTWTEECDPCDPGPLSSPAIGHDTDSVARTVMHGGRNDTPAPTNKTWVWDPAASDWLDKTGTSTTVALYSHRMSFDSSRHRFILFGGTTNGSNVLDRTYVGVRQSGFYNWTEVNPSPEPSGRCCMGMGYDSDRQEIIMFGGAESGGAKLDDSWRMDTNWDCIAGTCP
jgi:hypothetical protein